MGGITKRRIANAAAIILVLAAALLATGCGNPLTFILQGLVGGGPEAPTVDGPASPTSDWRPMWTWDTPTGTVTFRYSLDNENDWVPTDWDYWIPDWDLIGWHTLYVRGCDDSGRWSTSGSYALLIDPTWGMVVDGGSLLLGDDTGYFDEKPAHDTQLSRFWISSYEVTQQFYQAVMGNNPSYFTSANGYSDNPQKPVENVSFQDAIAFCNALSDAYGYTRAYDIVGSTVTWDPDADGFRLPTEAEWEFAARGGSASLGYLYAGSNSPDDVANYGNSLGETQAIGLLADNELGLYDMSGNVWEWCWDEYDETYYTWNTDWTDPRGPSGTSSYLGGTYQYVIRGGSYYNIADTARNAYRGYDYDDALYVNYGFRIVTNW